MADDKIERRHHGLCSGLEVGNVFTEQRRQPWVHFKIGVPHIPIQNTPSDTVMGAGAKPKDIPHGTYAVLIPAVVGAMQEMQAEITTLQGSLTGNATTSDLTVYSPSNFSGDSVGEAEIVAGQTSVRVSFGRPTASSQL